MKVSSGKDTGKSSGTIRAVPEPTRGPVTRETVQKLSRDSALSRAAEIAKKYAR